MRVDVADCELLGSCEELSDWDDVTDWLTVILPVRVLLADCVTEHVGLGDRDIDSVEEEDGEDCCVTD